jgi:DNA-binding GntR family transcriptional regulator
MRDEIDAAARRRASARSSSAAEQARLMASKNQTSALRRPTLTEEAYAAIKRRIICLALPPGVPFTEAQLAAELSLSKTPVREALARLQREGFVDVAARSGYSVAPVTLQDVRDLFALRILLEGEAACLAASTTPDPSQLRLLEEAARTSYDPDDPDSLAHFLRANTEFHAAVARVAKNERLVGVLEQVLDQMERVFHLGLSRTTGGGENVREHQALVKAILRGDCELARRTSVAHIRGSQSMVIDALLSSEALLSTNVPATPHTRPSLSLVQRPELK